MAQITKFEDFKTFIEEHDPIIVLDSCVLLDYYRYNSRTANKRLDVLESIKNKIWIPAHVHSEFDSNYDAVKKQSHNKYHNVSTEVKKLTNDFNMKLGKQFIQFGKYEFPKIHELESKIEPFIKKITNEIDSYKTKIQEEINHNKSLLKEDKMIGLIDDLVENNQVGESFSGTELLTICEEAEKRYQFHIPPGYMDKDKEAGKREKIDPQKPYGDYIIWKSILKKANEENCSILFATSDSKEDWWQLEGDELDKSIKAPRAELVSEFKQFVPIENTLLMLPLKEFIDHFSKLNKINVYYPHIELNAEEIIEEYISENVRLIESVLVHDGQLQEYMPMGIFEDIECLSATNIFVGEYNIDFNYEQPKAFISGNCNLLGQAFISESYGSEYTEEITYDLMFHILFSLELDLDIENEAHSLTDIKFNSVLVESAEPLFLSVE